MTMKKNKGRDAIGHKKTRSNVCVRVGISILLGTVVFIGTIFAVGGLFYTKEIGFDKLWFCYLIAAVLSTASTVLYAAAGLPLRGVLTGLAYSFGLVVAHAALISACNPAHQGNHILIILFSVIGVSLFCGMIGRRKAFAP